MRALLFASALAASALYSPAQAQTSFTADVADHTPQAAALFTGGFEQAPSASTDGFILTEEAKNLLYTRHTLTAEDLAWISDIQQEGAARGPSAWQEAVEQGDLTRLRVLRLNGIPLGDDLTPLLTTIHNASIPPALDALGAHFGTLPMDTLELQVLSTVMRTAGHQGKITGATFDTLLTQGYQNPWLVTTVLEDVLTGATPELLEKLKKWDADPRNPSLLVSAIHNLPDLVPDLLRTGFDPNKVCPKTGENAGTALIDSNGVMTGLTLEVLMRYGYDLTGKNTFGFTVSDLVERELEASQAAQARGDESYAGTVVSLAELKDNLVRWQELPPAPRDLVFENTSTPVPSSSPAPEEPSLVTQFLNKSIDGAALTYAKLTGMVPESTLLGIQNLKGLASTFGNTAFAQTLVEGAQAWKKMLTEHGFMERLVETTQQGMEVWQKQMSATADSLVPESTKKGVEHLGAFIGSNYTKMGERLVARVEQERNGLAPAPPATPERERLGGP